MESFSSILEILEHPNDNDIIVFVLGILFVLSIYHFLLYFQHKDKSYLFYSIYTGLIFLGHLNDPTNGFIPILIAPFSGFLHSIELQIIWVFSYVYFAFALTFLKIKLYSIIWYRIIYFILIPLSVICIYFEVDYLINGNYEIIINAHLFFLKYLSIVGLICYVPLFKVNSPLKYYIIIGSVIFFGTSLVAQSGLLPEDTDLNYSVFYVGIVLENILFALALGHKQKIILKEKNESQERLIIQLQENKKLQSEINVQFEEDVASLSKLAKAEKIEALQATYEKELTNLKMASLRSQMNPHFIFNSLNSIKLYIINNEKENAVYYLNKFSKLIRKILATTQEKEISLSDELETMELYINIENIRFNNEIDFTITIEESISTDTIKIPGLILQPFIENAIWHGLSSKKKKKKLELKIEDSKQTHIKISILDNGIGRKKSAEINKAKMHKKKSIGIKLTEERLSNFSKKYKNNYTLEFIDMQDQSKNGIGTNVILLIPYK